MALIATEDGLTVKKLFSSRKIPYSDLKSIQYIGDSTVTLMTSEGEEIHVKDFLICCTFPQEMIDAIVKYNIAFKNCNELDTLDHTYLLDEVNEMSDKVLQVAKKFTDEYAKQHLDPEYEIIPYVRSIEDYTSMFFKVTKNGVPLSDDPDAIDNMILSYMCEWVPDTHSGRYGITVEMEDEEAIKAFIQETLDEAEIVRNISH